MHACQISTNIERRTSCFSRNTAADCLLSVFTSRLPFHEVWEVFQESGTQGLMYMHYSQITQNSAKYFILLMILYCYIIEKVKTFKSLGSLLTNQNYIQEEIKCRLKHEIHVIIRSKHSCLLDFSLRI